MTSFSLGARRWRRSFGFYWCMLMLPAGLPMVQAQIVGNLPPMPAVTAEQTKDGLEARIGSERLQVSVCAGAIIHVVAGPGGTEPQEADKPWLLPASESCPGASFQYATAEGKATLTTSALKVSLSLERGNLVFSTADGALLLRENGNVPRTYEPAVVNGLQTFHAEDRFSPDTLEGYYGLGQHQSGLFNYRGATVKLAQDNTDVAIPLLLSSMGYALLWNTASVTEVDNRFPQSLEITTLAGDRIDYYFVYGPEFDQIIHRYRDMTGHTPMLPKWSYGFFQSKDRYVSQSEILDIAGRYRQEHIPLDAIVQDWYWWKTEGDPIFNSNYTDVPAELKSLHDEHVHAMISVWGLFDPHSANFQTILANRWDIHDAHVYDPSIPKARDFYWNNLPGKLLAMGWDAFWLDSAEPEEYWPHYGDAVLRDKTMAIGNGALYTNVFPFLHNNGAQDHWRATTSDKRVFLLTRSAFLGQQRVGATVWSGDVYANFWALSHQVPAGLNFAVSGYPYWTTDIGGYVPPPGGAFADPDYQEVYARWFEYGAFCPIFRTHGHREHNELWAYDKVEPILLNFDKLRYRLMPYIYSLAWRVHQDDYTIQRPLVMDWRQDPRVWAIGDQFMFGPAILVNPVLQKGALQRAVYLPAAPHWYNFWTGEALEGGREIEADAPLSSIPLFVRAGSILPMGPEIEYADEKPQGPIELRVYPGADGDFQLYTDEGDNYNYEKGAHALISIHWSDAARTVTIAGRQGSYTGMPQSIEFHIVLVGPNHGAGEGETAQPDKTVVYDGAALTAKLD